MCWTAGTEQVSFTIIERRVYGCLQVKVWLGEGMSHYYVLSRFLISRMLTVTKIPYMKVSRGDTVTSVLSDRHADTLARFRQSK